ncbi:hypothetical protein STVIR_0225 [Streptomyces viridochromogenes Tue57]|uniref:Uncharacterized protein n=1 Tax=Streptomyces viridochromogenes Tue57 TaxID=1160705 RepID=L8PS12_STRVR|nr:hypothetical protein STVIR_0225 [Streptomyces viridochromogenes Tue57]
MSRKPPPGVKCRWTHGSCAALRSMPPWSAVHRGGLGSLAQ